MLNKFESRTNHFSNKVDYFVNQLHILWDNLNQIRAPARSPALENGSLHFLLNLNNTI